MQQLTSGIKLFLAIATAISSIVQRFQNQVKGRSRFIYTGLLLHYIKENFQ